MTPSSQAPSITSNIWRELTLLLDRDTCGKKRQLSFERIAILLILRLQLHGYRELRVQCHGSEVYPNGLMGCGPPSKYERIYTTVRGICEFKKDFSAVGISEEDIGKFYWIFCKIDTDGSQLIDVLELLMFLDVERTRFTKRIFSIFDEDKSGKIDFREFVLAVWNYCTLGKLSLILFAFDIYDQDKSGYIDLKEAQNLVRDVYGSKYELNVHAKRVSAKLEELDHQNINLQTFQKFAEKHQALLYPAFEMQTRIQDHVVGTNFWHILIENRVRMFHDRYISVKEILERYEERADLNRLTTHPPEETDVSRSIDDHHQMQDHSVVGTADGHESIKSYSRKKSLKTIAISPIVQSLLDEGEDQVRPKRSIKGHGLTADGLSSATPPVLQRKPSVIQRRSSSAGTTEVTAPAGNSAAKTKFKIAAHAVALSTEKKRKKSEFRH